MCLSFDTAPFLLIYSACPLPYERKKLPLNKKRLFLNTNKKA